MIVVTLKKANDAEGEVQTEMVDEVPYKIILYPDHLEIYGMQHVKTRDWCRAKPRKRSFWFSDMIALNETFKRINEGKTLEPPRTEA